MKILFFILFVISTAFIIQACDVIGEFKGGYGDYIFRIQVDTVITPDSTALNSPIPVIMRGYIGANHCYTFSHFQSAVFNNELEITCWGYLRYLYRTQCESGETRLDAAYYVTPLERGIFKIKIHQPDGTIFYREVSVY